MALAGTRSMEFSAASHRGAFSAHLDGIEHGGVKGRRWQRRATIYLPSQGPPERGLRTVHTDCFTFYRKEGCWCGVQGFSSLIVAEECLADLLIDSLSGNYFSSNLVTIDVLIELCPMVPFVAKATHGVSHPTFA